MPQEEYTSTGVGARAPGSSVHGHRRRDVDVVKGAFQALEGSKEAVLERIRGLRAEVDDNLRGRLQTETDLKDTSRQLAESRERIRELETELAALKGELNTAKTMLDEIDQSLH